MNTSIVKYQITASIVIYNNSFEDLQKAVNSFLNTELEVKLLLIDNSPTDFSRFFFKDSRIEYIFNNENVGFGRGHNIAIRKVCDVSKYHLVLNPDIYYEHGVLEELISFLESDEMIGLIVPKVIYPDNRIQYLTKLLPSIFDFLLRRLVPFKSIKELLSRNFELRHTGYDKIVEAPYLSGCFMIFRINVLKKIDGFDENFFLHMEDLDISRRVWNTGFKNVFYPNVSVKHNHVIKRMTNFNTLLIYTKSAIYYFNKWGWVFDKNRRKVNRETLQKIRKIKVKIL